jgi:hypothetical protein
MLQVKKINSPKINLEDSPLNLPVNGNNRNRKNKDMILKLRKIQKSDPTVEPMDLWKNDPEFNNTVAGNFYKCWLIAREASDEEINDLQNGKVSFNKLYMQYRSQMK